MTEQGTDANPFVVTNEGGDLDTDLAACLDTLDDADVVKTKLKEEEIFTLALAMQLTEARLEKLGFTKMGRRMAILAALNCMRFNLRFFFACSHSKPPLRSRPVASRFQQRPRPQRQAAPWKLASMDPAV